MTQFIQYNCNPKGRKTGDCSTRALATILNISYEKALQEQCDTAIKYCYGLTSKETIEKIMAKYGWTKMKQPRKDNGKKYLVGEINKLTSENALILMANHFSVMCGGAILDIWDCRDKTIGNYWVKKGETYTPVKETKTTYRRIEL